MRRVVSGFRLMPEAPACPYCGDHLFAIEDDGDAETYRVLCWCGVTARVRQDDPDLVSFLAEDTE